MGNPTGVAVEGADDRYPIVMGNWQQPEVRSTGELSMQLPPDNGMRDLFLQPSVTSQFVEEAGWKQSEGWPDVSKEVANRVLVANLFGETPQARNDTYDLDRAAVGRVIFGQEDLDDEGFHDAATEHYREQVRQQNSPPGWLEPGDAEAFPELAQQAEYLRVGRAMYDGAFPAADHPVSYPTDEALIELGRRGLVKPPVPQGEGTDEPASIWDPVKAFGGGIADGALTMGEGLFNESAQILHRLPTTSAAVAAMAGGSEGMANAFESQRRLAAKFYRVDDKFAQSFSGHLLSGLGQLLPVVVASRMGVAGLAALQAQGFQSAMDDARQAAEAKGEVFDPNRGFAFALTMGTANALINKIKVDKLLGPWLRAGGATGIRAVATRIYRAAFVNGAMAVGQGALNDVAANVFGVDRRKVFDPEKRGMEFGVGVATGAAFGGVAEGVRRLVSKPITVRTESPTDESMATVGEGASPVDDRNLTDDHETATLTRKYGIGSSQEGDSGSTGGLDGPAASFDTQFGKLGIDRVRISTGDFYIDPDSGGRIRVFYDPDEIIRRRKELVERGKTGDSVERAILGEELIHAAHYVALKDKWRVGGSGGSFVDFIYYENLKIFRDIRETLESAPQSQKEVLNRIIESSYHTYFSSLSNELPKGGSVAILQEILLKGEAFDFVNEFLRQAVQMKRQGLLTEDVHLPLLKRIADWVEPAIKVLREKLLGVSQGEFGKEAQSAVARIESVLDEIRFPVKDEAKRNTGNERESSD